MEEGEQMKISHKLALGFFSTSLIVAATTCITLLTNRGIQYDLTQISQSSISEVESATEMAFTLQAIQTNTQELLAERYREIINVEDVEHSVEEVPRLKTDLRKEIITFDNHLAAAEKATKTGIQVDVHGYVEPEEIEEEKEELKLLAQIETEFIVHKKFINQYLAILTQEPNEPEKFLDTTLEPHFTNKFLPLIRAYEADAELELISEAKEVRNSIINADRLVISSTFITLFIAICLSRLIALSIASPIVELKNAVTRIGKGSLDAKINIFSDDEVGILADSFNRMVDNLSQTTVSKVYVDNILGSMVDSLIVIDLNAIIIKVNQATLELLGYEENDLVSQSIKLLFIENTEIAVETLLQKGFVASVETNYLTKNNNQIPVSFSASVMRDGQGNIQGFVCVAQNITKRKQAEEALRQAEAKYRTIFENAMEGIYQSTPQGYYLSVNPALARICGYESPDELLANISDIERQLYVEPNRRSEFIDLMHEGGIVTNFEYQIYRQDRSIVWVAENARAVYDSSGTLAYYEGCLEDVTQRKQTQEQLRHHALHDTLTGLPNRTLFTERLEQMVQRAKKHKDYLCAVLFLDLDRFKVVNDSLGHLIGDRLLIAVSRKLEACIRPKDMIARLGGDEFAILLDDIKDVEYATQIAERLKQTLAAPFNFTGQEVYTSASIGIVVGNEANGWLDDLLRSADIAMYQAKAMGKGRYEVFDTALYEQTITSLQLETELRQAIDRQEFRVYYQPIVLLATGKITGFEALVRWHHPTQGVISPADFIPIAEETGLILPIGQWVLQSACGQMRQWQKQFPSSGSLTISVNISAKQFTQPNLYQQVAQILLKNNLAPSTLRLEITESVLMDKVESITTVLLQLKSLGVSLYLDDFGTGYSSLSYLHRFPIDTLKIDRSFISRMGFGNDNSEIVRAITTLAQSLNMDVIAEGIETVEQLMQLSSLQCKYGQGYFFSPPLDAQTAGALIAEKLCGMNKSYLADEYLPASKKPYL